MSTIPLISITTENSQSSDSDTNADPSECNTLGTTPNFIAATTDVEDLYNTSDEEGGAHNLDSTIEKHRNTSKKETKTGTKKKNLTKTTPQNWLVTQENEQAELTDCENLQLSDAEDMAPIKHKMANVNLEQYQCGVINAHESFKNKKKKSVPEIRAKDESESPSSDSETCKIQRKKSTKWNKKPNHTCGNLQDKYSVSDDECCGAAFNPKLLEPEELTWDCSDIDDDNDVHIPNFHISFSKHKQLSSPSKHRSKPISKLNLALPQQSEEAVTDVENALTSNDEDDDLSTNLKIPNAIVADEKFLTDTEDFDDPDVTAAGYETNLSLIQREQLPSPTREMIILKENRNNDPTSVRIMPLTPTHVLAIGKVKYSDESATDYEDVSDYADDENEFYAYTPETAALIDNEIVESSESFISPKSDRTTTEPKTDTEEISMAKDTYRKRRHKNKSGKKLSVSISNQSFQATDVEEILFSDNNTDRKKCHNVQPKKTIASNLCVAAFEDDGGKTDTEFISDEEDHKIPSNQIYRDDSNIILQNFFSTTTSVESHDCGNSSAKNSLKPKISITFKLSPGHDTQNPLTDTEDILSLSEVDESCMTFSRAQTVTPSATQLELNDSGSSKTYDKNTEVFDRGNARLQIKEQHETGEATTDIEYLENEQEKLPDTDQDQNDEESDL